MKSNSTSPERNQLSDSNGIYNIKSLMHRTQSNNSSCSRSPSPNSTSSAVLNPKAYHTQIKGSNTITLNLRQQQSHSSSSPVAPSPSNLLPPPPPPPQSSSSQAVWNAKQLSKLKRFLTTLQQFAADITPETAERVRLLILNLINSTITIEEFHSRLQEATHFPLRPFVIPFLKANLPLLQRELSYFSKLDKQTAVECLVLHPEAVFNRTFDPTNLVLNNNQPNVSNPVVPPNNINNINNNNNNNNSNNNNNNNNNNNQNNNNNNVSNSKSIQQNFQHQHNIKANINENGKRKSPDSGPYQRTDVNSGNLLPPKRAATSPMRLHPPNVPHPHPQQSLHANIHSPLLPPNPLILHPSHTGFLPNPSVQPSQLPPNFTNNPLFTGTQIKLEDLSIWRELREKEMAFHNYIKNFEQDYRELFDRNLEEDYKNVDSFLNCIVDAVGKAKRNMNVLQSKTSQFQKQMEGYEADIKRKYTELISFTIRQTEERINEIRKRADDEINEVKKQAAIELQKTAIIADQKANEIIKRERDHFEKLLKEAHKKEMEQSIYNTDHQEDNPNENCWNCGRRATETCTGCHKAKYCGQFCQHKHWEHNHHRTCNNKTDSDISINTESESEDLILNVGKETYNSSNNSSNNSATSNNNNNNQNNTNNTNNNNNNEYRNNANNANNNNNNNNTNTNNVNSSSSSSSSTSSNSNTSNNSQDQIQTYKTKKEQQKKIYNEQNINKFTNSQSPSLNSASCSTLSSSSSSSPSSSMISKIHQVNGTENIVV